jgi:GT2 family glycosyltransferase
MTTTDNRQPIDISVVIVTYKTDPEVLRSCFVSLAATRDVSLEIFVIDNAGDKSMTRFAKEILPEATVIVNEENRGFAAAINQGMIPATGRYVLLLNPDTSIPPDALKKMIDHLDADKEVGIASSIIRYPDGTHQESVRRFPKFLDQLLILLKFPHLFKKIGPVDTYMMREVDLLKTQDVDSIMGAFMFIRREVIEKLGGLDERYFIWFEEVDYCKMAVDAGFKIRQYGDVEIIHHKGHSFNKVATIRKQKWIRTSLRKYMKKHHGFLPWAVLWMLTPLFIVLAYGAAQIKKN